MTCMIAIVVTDFSVIAVNTSTIAVTPIHGYKKGVFIAIIYVLLLRGSLLYFNFIKFPPTIVKVHC